MSNSGVRVGVGARVVYGGQLLEVAELHAGPSGTETLLRPCRGQGGVVRVSLWELLTGRRARLVPDGEGPSANDDGVEPADVVLSTLPEAERAMVVERAAHIREVLTGYRSGTAELAASGEPRSSYEPGLPLTARYEAKAAELGVSLRTVAQWVADFRQHGEAGLARGTVSRQKPLGLVDERWVETALEVMVEHTDQSRPSQTMVIKRTNARVIARYGPDVVKLPSRATAYRILEHLENRHPTFHLSTKRNRDIANRPGGVYGKLRPTRPGEYLLMDTTRLDVFALDPVTLRWVQAELTVGMDWYTRCITGIRLTPVSTKSVDAAAVLYQAYRPRPAGKEWPTHAVWPEHGVPRSVLMDVNAVEGPLVDAAGPAIVPETVVVDHGRIYLSDHLTSVCQRMGISIQPARLRTGRDKGPVERFFRTIREDLLQALPGYKGPDVHSRGLDPESEAFFYLDELEAIIREWVAVVYHHRPHDSLIDPHVPGLRMSPAMMFEHGTARAGYIEALPDDEWRRIHRRSDALAVGKRTAVAARMFLYELISGQPAARLSSRVGFKLFSFPRSLTPHLLAELNQHGLEFLASQGCTGEPVTWDPPPAVFDGLSLPGANSDPIDRDRLFELLRTAPERRSMSAVAVNLGTTNDVLYEYLSRDPLPPRPPESQYLRNAQGHHFRAAREKLPRNRLSTMYHDEGLSIREIATRTQLSRQTVANLVDEYRIEVAVAPTRNPINVDADWVKKQYLDELRTFPEIAAEIGVSASGLTRWARRRKIQRRGRGSQNHAAALNARRRARSVPPLLKAAMAETGGWERLHRFKHVACFPSLDLAAESIRTTPCTLSRQIRRLERETGGTLIHRATRRRPMTVTKHGASVLQAISELEKTSTA